VSAARARTPVCSVVDADGVVVGCGQGLDGAQEDALERAVRLREARLGRPLRPGEREELEVWAAALGLAPAVEAPSASAAAHLTAAEAGADAAEPAPGPAFSCATPRRVRWRGPALGQVLLFPELGPPPATCPGCRAAIERALGPGRPRRWCATCRPSRPRDPRLRPAVGDRARWEGVEVEVVGRERMRPVEGGPRRQVAVVVRLPSGREDVILLSCWRTSEPS
jgi:hypothetical protein